MKKILLLVVVFAAGFLTHAFFFPELLSNGLVDAKKIIIPNQPKAGGANQDDQQITKVSYDGEKFSRHNITIQKTRYLHVTNTHKTKRMELIGSINALNTPRGYAESETLQVQFNDKGQFAVADKNNPGERLVITVK